METPEFVPQYLKTPEKVRKEIEEQLFLILQKCELCPRKCKVNRLQKEGECKVKFLPKIASYSPHYGEEKILVGSGGSGTIFFSGCNLSCIFCQNYEISHFAEGVEVGFTELAQIMINLQNQDCENINFVTPTHFVPQIIKAVNIAISKGLKIPLVYNCGGYESLKVIKLLNYFFDIYMPDAKYGDDKTALQLSNAKNYTKINQQILKEMYAQVGDIKLNKGVAQRGLIIRYLVLPNNLSQSFKVLDFIKNNLSEKVFINIMSQYHPCYQAYQKKELSRSLTSSEYQEIISYAKEIGLKNVYAQNTLL